MTSKLAKSEVERMWKQGLSPTFEDIIKLNALGVKIEHGADTANFSNCPRIAFLGDILIRQPTVYKQIWIDQARNLIKDDFKSQLYMFAYALNATDEELPKLKTLSGITSAVRRFVEQNLIHFTDTQIFAAVDYALNGNDPDSQEYFTPEQKEHAKDILDVPDSLGSYAKTLLDNALSRGIDKDIQAEVTVPELERIVISAMLQGGIDVLENEHAQAAARFYACVGQIKTRLQKEKGETNG